MPLGDNVVRFAPDGAFFTTGGVLGLENNVAAAYGVGPSHSISAWIRPASLPSVGTEVDFFRLWRFGGAAFQIGLGIENVAGSIRFYYVTTNDAGSTTLQLSGTSTPVVGQWYHVVGCKNDTFTQRLFVNAVDEATTGVGVPAQTDIVRSASIGLHGVADFKNFDGDIHSIAIWDTAIPQESVRSIYNGGWKDFDLRNDRHPCYNDAADLQHWWRLGQGTTATHTAGDDIMTDWVSSGGIGITEQVGTIEQTDIMNVGEGPSSTSVNFDTSGPDALAMPGAVPIGIANEWTISCWVKPRDVLTVDSAILYIGGPAPTNSAIGINQQGGTANDPLRVFVHSTTGTTIQLNDYFAVLSEDEWQHIAVSWDGITLNTFLDGVLLTPNSSSSGAGVQTDASRVIEFGATSISGVQAGFWSGRMGHVGIWNTVLTPTEIESVFSQGHCLDLRYNVGSYACAEFLQNYFKPGEDTITTGRNFIDMNRSAASRVLTGVTGSPVVSGDAPTSPFVAPPLGDTRSVSLDGVAEYFANTSNQLIGIANAWTISLWANRQQLLTSRHLIEIETSGSPNNGIFWNADGSTNLNCSLQDSAGTVFKAYAWTNVFPNLDEWRNLVFTWDGVSLLMYNNGLFQAPTGLTVDIAGTQTDTARSILYGAFRVGFELPFPGYLGHLGIWNTALTVLEPQEIFAGGHSIDLRVNQGTYGSAASLKHYWRPGFADVGFTDEQAIPTAINFVNSVNLDASDIVNEAP